MNNNEETNGKSTDSGLSTISLNIPITTTEAKFQEVLDILGIDAPPRQFENINQINLQISIQQEASDE